MPVILNIETATQVCSVALTRGETLLSIRESDEPNTHSASTAVFVDQVMKESGLGFHELAAVAVSKGPGSYTGLRIGVSTAKGLCYALGIPLISIGTLEAMAVGLSGILYPKGRDREEDTLLCPLIDARRMEVYRAIFDMNMNQVEATAAEVVSQGSFSPWIADRKICFFGSGADKCIPILGGHPNARFYSDFKVSARYMALLATQKFIRQEFEDTAYFEPYYLKEFIPGLPKVRGLD
jgi:tRNA threonylcarbamoyladenosine biosynthesis protein TsaB